MREDQQLEIFIRKHYSSMCAVALRFIGSPDIAQDITQEVIIKFWKNRANYENIKSTDNFLYTMIKNEALNYLRGSQREKQRYNHLEVEEFEHPQVLNMLIEEEINQILIHCYPYKALVSCASSCQGTRTRKSQKSWVFP